MSIVQWARSIKATSANATIADFRGEAQAIVDSFLSGDKSQAAALNEFMRLVDGAWIEVAEQAWADGGRDLGDLDSSRLTDDLAAQRDFARDFFDKLEERKQASLEAGEETAELGDNNVDLWSQGLVGHYNDWKIESAVGTAELFQWILGATEEHCETCLMLANDGPHTAGWFTRRGYVPGQNGANLACGGWYCDCSLSDVGGHDFTLTPDMLEE